MHRDRLCGSCCMRAVCNLNWVMAEMASASAPAAGLGNTSSTLQSVLALDSVPPSNVSPAPSPPPSPANDSSSSVPIGAIVGGVVGGAVVLALVALLLVRRRRRRAGYAQGQALGDGNESPKALGAMEAGRGADLLGFPKPGDMPNGYKVAVAAGEGVGAGSRVWVVHACLAMLQRG